MSKKILLVDDDRLILEAVSAMLDYYGYDVKTVWRGEKVFETIGEFEPDLILMDVRLSGMDGRMLCKAIKSVNRIQDIPIILISGYGLNPDILHEPGAPNDFVLKPFDIADLLQSIERQLAA
ncbi:response regulator [Mucilaginibacter gynuensis]